ncbi:MAG: antitoxin family protein [Elusimicrobia bacterium]|nr:antitoxin family protein [Elusimicrobiota bacterium]
MSITIPAVFENGIFRPIKKVYVAEHQKVKIIIDNDVPTKLIASAAGNSKSFKFLKKSKEDIYTIKDGEPV